MRHAKQQGFTLIEVLVAMAIFGVVAVTLLSQSANQTRLAIGIEDRLIAHWVANNTLTDLQVSGQMPEVGVTESNAVMAGRDWFVTIITSPTPVANVRNVEVKVAPYDVLSGEHGAPITSLIGFTGAP